MQQYKNSLDQQIHDRQALRAYGNMTNVEKEMNKDQLLAYKNYDVNEYNVGAANVGSRRFANVPPQKNPSPVINGPKIAALNEEKLAKQEERLQQYGILQRTSPNARHAVANNQSSLDINLNAAVAQNLTDFRSTPQPLANKLYTQRAPINNQEFTSSYKDVNNFHNMSIGGAKNGTLHQKHHSMAVGTPEPKLEGFQPINIVERNGTDERPSRFRAGSRNSVGNPINPAMLNV